VTIDGNWIRNWIIEHLQLVTTSKDFALTVLHTSRSTIRYTRYSQSVLSSPLSSAFILTGWKLFHNCSRAEIIHFQLSNSKLNWAVDVTRLNSTFNNNNNHHHHHYYYYYYYYYYYCSLTRPTPSWSWSYFTTVSQSVSQSVSMAPSLTRGRVCNL
jgi:hypothetical protein